MPTISIYMRSGPLLAIVLGSCVCAGASQCVATPKLEAHLKVRPDAIAYSRLGNWFRDHHKFDCASEAFETALKFEPDSADLSFEFGSSLYAAGNVAESIKPLEQSIQIAPTLLKGHLALGRALSDLGQLSAAKAQWDTALKIDPTSTIALDGLWKVLIAQGDYAEVIAHRDAVPLDENLMVDLALAYSKQGLPDEAVATLNEGLKRFPASDTLTDAATIVYVQKGQLGDALSLAAIAARAHPDDFTAQLTYLRILMLNSNRDVAPPLALKLLAIAPHNAEVLYLAGVLDRFAGQDATARSHLEESLALNPNQSSAHYHLGVVLFHLGEMKDAKDQLETAIALGERGPDIHYQLAMIERDLGEVEGARAQLKLYKDEVKANDNRLLAFNNAKLAEGALAAGDQNKAADLYREAVKATPDDAMLNYKLALVLSTIADSVGARIALEQAVKVDPTFAAAQYQLGYLEFKNGEVAAAEDHFRLALQAAPGFSQAWVSLAATLATQSRFPEAQQAVANALRLNPEDSEAIQLDKELAKVMSQN